LADISAVHLRRAKARASGATRVELAVPDDIRQARVSFGAFCAAIGKPNAAHHQLWADAFVTGQDTGQLLQLGGPNTAVLAPRGPLDVETLVATPDGWRALKDIRANDLVYADDGTPAKVLATVDYDATECWEVVLSDGTSVVCDDSHRWDVRSYPHPDSAWSTVTLQQIRTMARPSGHSGQAWVPAPSGQKAWLYAHGAPKYEVPRPWAVDYPRRDLPLDPYLLGILLGNGTLGLQRMECRICISTSKAELVEEAQKVLPAGCSLAPPPSSSPHTHRITPAGLGSPVRLGLERLGLLSCRTRDRFIPEVYLTASIGQRTALLQGLMDTNGEVIPSATGAGLRFCSASPQLTADVANLCRSLGGFALVHKPRVRNTRTPTHLCGLRLPRWVEPFRIRSKAEPYDARRSQATGARRRSIVDIRPAGKRPVRCITIEHPSERFIVKDYVSVKNSAKSTVLGLLVAWAIGIHTEAGIMLRMLYLAYSLDIARSRSHTIKNLINGTRYREIFPRVRLSKERSSDELWSIDYDFAGIDPGGDDPYTLVGQGLSGSITSRRSQLIVLDDVIKSSRSIENPSLRQVLITNWNEVVRPTLIEGGRCIALGTRFSTVDIFHTTFNEKNGWRVLTQKAIVQDEHGQEQSYWPEWVSLEYLRKLREEDPISFSFQFQNQPVSTSALDFPRSWLVAAPLQTEHDAYCIGIDLSSGLKERNDWTVFTLAGRRDEGVQMIDFRRMRSMGNLEKIDLLCELLLDWGLIEQGTGAEADRWFGTDVSVTINIEATSYQRSLKADAEEILIKQRGLTNLILKPIDDMSGDKLSRLRGRLGLFQTGRITWNELINWEPYWGELTSFGSCDHDDCPDSMLLALRGLVGQGQIQTAWDRWVQAA